MSTRAGPSAYALLTDGTTMRSGSRGRGLAAVRELHAKMSPDNLYLRFFSMSPAAASPPAVPASSCSSTYPGWGSGSPP